MANEGVYPLIENCADVILGILNRGHIGIIEVAKEKAFIPSVDQLLMLIWHQRTSLPTRLRTGLQSTSR